jgi:hypothetical protein
VVCNLEPPSLMAMAKEEKILALTMAVRLMA